MLEEKPVGIVTFPPSSGDRYKVRKGDSWDSVAKANSLSTWGLIEFNFPIVKGVADFQKKCRMVNWLLNHYVGCTKSDDGKNYRFDGSDSPGYIYIPLYDVQPEYVYRVKLHFRSLALTAVPFDSMFRACQRAYAPHGIRVDFASGMSLGLSDDEAARLSSINGSCDWEVTTGEMDELQRLAGVNSRSEIVVYYVNRFDNANTLGCGGHRKDRPACMVAAAAARYSTAHEVGHVLLTSAFTPVHQDGDIGNLMYPYENRTGDPPTLTDAQVTQIKKSICCVAL